MVLELPQAKLVKYFPLFQEHGLKNLLAQNLARSTARCFVDDLENPKTFMFTAKDYPTFLAGNSKSLKVKEMFAKIPERKPIFIVPSQEENWERAIRKHWKLTMHVPRTALSAENLSLEHIQEIIKPLPEGFHVEKVNLEIAKKIEKQVLEKHWLSKIKFYGGPEEFVKETVAFCVREGEKIVSLAAGDKASIPIIQSLEVDILTLPKYRGKGFALITGAKLIEYCLKRGVVPNWDAANEMSVKLALKLGYTDPKPYRIFLWRSKPMTFRELEKNYDPEFKRELEEFRDFKTGIEARLANGNVGDARNFMLSSYTKLKTNFARTLSAIDRMIENKIYENSDELHFREYAEEIRKQMKELERFKEDKEKELG